MKITKESIYKAVEGVTPPFIFKLFRKSLLYPYAVKIARRYTSVLKPEIIKVPDGDIKGFKLKLNPIGEWQKTMINGTYDIELFEYLKTKQLDGKVIYDIGAHIGYHSLLFATYVGNTGKIFTFEPSPANIKRIQEILALNPDIKNTVTLLDLALSDTNGTTQFLSTDNIEGGTSSGGFIDEATTIWTKETYIEKAGFKTTDVKVMKIDTLIAEATIAPPDVLKIDVEGAEQLVLRGAEETIEKHHPTIIIEFHSIYSTFECMQILTKHNYTLTILKKESDGRLLMVGTHINNNQNTSNT